MATTPEGAVKRRAKAALTAVGAYTVMPVSNGMGAHGVPDFLVCHQGRFFGIEAKAGSNKPTDLQISNLRKIHEAGGVALVINETNVGLLRDILDAAHPQSNYTQFAKAPKPEGDDAPRKRAPQEKR